MTIFTILATALLAQAPVAAPAPATVRVTLTTSAGPIVLELEKERAPLTVANFLRYVDGKRLDGSSFYRTVRTVNATEYGLVQFGNQNDPKRTFPPVAHEPTSRTGLSHKSGTLSLARAAPGTGAGDFFIVIGDTPSLDADPAAAGDNAGFAAFGRVAEGMDVVKAIHAAATDPVKGQGVMKGQFLAAPVRILTARRVKP